jgi:iron complex transport system substrate-binding protein
MPNVERIVSLLPSSTEIVSVLGLGRLLVGRSHECDYPHEVAALPVCTAPRFDPSGSSAEIDRSVTDLLRDALSVYAVDEDMLRRLRPDLIVTQSQCEVCAVGLSDVEDVVRRHLEADVRVVSLAADSIEGIWRDVEAVADAVGAGDVAGCVVATLRERMDAISARAVRCLRRPRVLAIEWIDPLMVAGNWVPELIDAAGATPILAQKGRASTWLEWEAVVDAEPDLIVMMPCGFSIERTLGELASLEKAEAWGALRAVRERRVFVADGSQYFNRPGPRIVESLEMLAEIAHPSAFDFGHHPHAWRRI